MSLLSKESPVIYDSARQLPQIVTRTCVNRATKSYSNISHVYQLPLVSFANPPCHHQVLRYKSKKGEKKPAPSDTETEDEDAWVDEVQDKSTKIMQITAKSPRIDLILKSALGIARNKIETLFYESKIRVNGEKLLKKSDLAQEGDEIDVVKGVSVSNPKFLTVARVEVLGIREKDEEDLSIKIRRCKSLTVENYDDKKFS